MFILYQKRFKNKILLSIFIGTILHIVTQLNNQANILQYMNR